MIGAIAALAVFLAACSDETPSPKTPRSIRAMTVTSELLGETFSQTGEIRARYEIPMSFRLDGLLVKRIDVGSAIKAGDIVASVDKTPSLNNVAAAKAQLDAAVSEVSIADLTAARNWELLSKNAISQAQVQQGDANLKAARARLEVASASLANAEQTLSYTDLKANRDGIISAVSVNEGQVVGTGQTVLTLSSNTELDAVFDVPEQILSEQMRDIEVQVRSISNPAVIGKGKVREITPSADTATRTYRVKVTLESSIDSFPLGAAVTGTVVLSPTRVFKVPASALANVGGNQAVFVYDTATKSLTARGVKVARYDDHDMLISEGLADGEIIATAGVSKLRDGELVSLEKDLRS
ncbi:efflux RND transporter periplasmic adaptor subunit [Rhizobium sp. P28RR-XV]|uniref:efflux RND transporter periplasmic adaptor subunit n=1 Tax=Rhizobium sp. P28RR-XV TaxID=2726737 RepID=UPI001FF06D31|nr:efflux RND transporter periplasmic adaptor subunit [Rhizobium sp. P28RR-XV]